jgi:hypothetical protein
VQREEAPVGEQRICDDFPFDAIGALRALAVVAARVREDFRAQGRGAGRHADVQQARAAVKAIDARAGGG